MAERGTSQRPRRVLHVLAGLGAGGIEAWLMHVLRTADGGRMRFDFLLNDDAARFYDDEAESLGATIVRGPSPHRPRAYLRNLREVLRAGSYDVVHSHMYTFSGMVLRSAHRAGVPVRIAQSHNTATGANDTRLRRRYEAAMRRLIWRHATAGVGVSEAATTALFGRRWHDDPRFAIMHIGFDFSRFAALPPPEELRAALHIPAGRVVVGHVGSHTEQKNHPWVLDVFARLLEDGVDAHLLLLTSPDRGPLAAEVERRGLADRSLVAETGADVPALMGAMDVFLLPSRWEGLGVVALEAQAAGLPVLASDEVPPEIEVIGGRVTRLPLDEGLAAWADAAQRLLATPRLPAATAAAALEESAFGIEASLRALAQLYRA